MRIHGTLTKWNDDRGFGFITPAERSEEIFVHISQFPKKGGRPQLNEVISFETETGPNGKPRAIRVMRPGQHTASRRPRSKNRQDRPSGLLGTILGVLAIAAIGAYGYKQFTRSPPVPSPAQAAAQPMPSTEFKCDGRTMCSQMTSCAEAKYFLQHCPNTQMDGNNDGEPCEQQWCN
jgi:cold shock CspA family protein